MRTLLLRRSSTMVALCLAVTVPACSDDGGSGPTETTTATTTPALSDLDAGDAGDGTSAPGPLTLRPVGLEVDEPIAMVAIPGSTTMLLALRSGTVLQVDPDGDDLVAADEPVVDITDLVGSTSGERGLLGLAVHPEDGRLYLSYTRASDGASQVDELLLSAEGDRWRAGLGTRRNLIDVDQPYSNHNGGHVAFGPDGALYLGLGDGGGAGDPEGRAQDPESLLGKLIRLDPEGETAPEIYSTGLRNPWRFAFDPGTGDLWVADVGQDDLEEVNHVTAADGAGRDTNFGWDLREGDQPFAGASYSFDDVVGPLVDPVHTYGRDGGCSITGGVVYRGARIDGLDGWYLFSDLCAGGVRALRPVDSGVEPVQLVEGFSSVVSFATDDDGEVYVISLDEGVRRLVAA